MIEKGEDFSKFFRWMDDYPEFSKLNRDVQRSFGWNPEAGSFMWSHKITFAEDFLLARYGGGTGKYFTALVSSNVDHVKDHIAWYKSAVEKGGGIFKIPAGTRGWIGRAGPQKLVDNAYGLLDLRWGAMQVYIPDNAGIRKVIGWGMT